MRIGTSWSVVSSPSPGTMNNYLGVAAVPGTATEVVAVRWSNSGNPVLVYPLSMYYC